MAARFARFPRLFQLPQVSAWLAVAVGCGVLIGWAFSIPTLKSVLPGLATIKPNTALAMVLAGFAMFCLSPGSGAPVRRVPALAFAGALTALTSRTLCQYWPGVDLGMDGLLLRAPLDAPDPYSPRMAVATACGFLVLGLGILALACGRVLESQLAALFASLPAFATLVTYLYDLRSLSTFHPFSSTALPTAGTLLVLGFGLAAARPDRGLATGLQAEGAGGVAVRRFLPVALLLPVLGGWVYLLVVRNGRPHGTASFAVFAAAVVLILVACVLGLAVSVFRVELAGRSAHEALRDSEARFRTLAEALPDLLVLYFPGGEREYCSPSFLRYTGSTSGDLQREGWAPPWHPEEAERIEGVLWQSLASGEDVTEEARLRRHDGVYRRHLARGLAVRHATGRPLRWLLRLTDVEELRCAETEIGLHAERLERGNRDLQQFVHLVSHDLQQPLERVSTAADQLATLQRGRLQPEGDELIDFIREGALRMQALIQGLLAYSRIEIQGAPLAPVSFHDVLDSVLSDLAAAIAESGALITADPLPSVRADALQLAQLLRNLLSNAIKYGRPGVAPEIHLSAAREVGGWRFAVADNGIGIEPRHFDRIFLIFQRLHGRNQYGGTGIGLAICKRVVERHGGRIWVESRPGAGSTFLFTLAGATSASA